MLLSSGHTGGGILVRRDFVWRRTDDGISPGRLGKLVERRDPRLLEAYLLLLSSAKRLGSELPIPTERWLDALGFDHTPSGVVGLSKLFARLRDRGFVQRAHAGRFRTLSLLLEDGSGPYTDPGL